MSKVFKFKVQRKHVSSMYVINQGTRNFLK